MKTRTYRLLNYAPTSLEELNMPGGKERIGAHTDEGILTLLFQRPGKYQNGLQALSK
jgi:isopenicillin N synthase-like dioxygenase